MTKPPPPPPPPGRGSNAVQPGEPAPGWAAALAGLAREVEDLRLTLDPLQGVAGRVEELAQIVARLAETTAGSLTPGEPEPVQSWLDHPTRVRQAHELLEDLIRWMGRIYLRYGDARGLPECWLWHPDIVEELLWLYRAWADAYRVDGAPVAKAADWHDRWRPGVVRRITGYAGNCSLDNHLHNRNRHSAPEVPHAYAADKIASWWGSRRREPAPEPTAEQLAAATSSSSGSRHRH